jgi:site-specific DNA-cytosine methylase
MAVRKNPLWIKVATEKSVKSFPKFNIAMGISMPFLGIDGAGRAMLEAKWPFEVKNGIDHRHQVFPALVELHGDSPELKCMDINKFDDLNLAPSEGYIGTSPCQDFSLLFAGAGVFGDRGCLFIRQLLQVKHLAEKKERPLRWMMLETVMGFLAYREGGCAFHVVQNWWENEMPGWTPLQVWKVQLRDASSACSRGRCVLVSCSKEYINVIGDVPVPPPKHPPVDLETFLMESSRAQTLRGSTENLKTNIRDWNVAMTMTCKEKKLDCGVGVVDVSRKIKGPFKAYVSVGFCPLLTTKNAHLYVLKSKKLCSAKVSGHGRYLKMEERAALHGVVYSSLKGQSDRQALISLGNMFPVNLAGVCLHQIMVGWEVFEKRALHGCLMNKLNRMRPLMSPEVTPPTKKRSGKKLSP